LETLCGLFRYARRIDIKSDTCFRNITWGLLPTGCQGVVRKDDCGCYSSECGRLMFTTENFNFLFYFNLTKGVSTMILKVVGQVKGHKNKMTMTLDVEALRNSLIKNKTLTSKKIKTMANKSTRLANTKKWADFKDFFEKKAEIQNSVSEVRSWSERETS